MANLLPIPFKKPASLNVRDAVREYLHQYAGVHPDEFKEDINRWQTLRKDGVGGVVHINQIDFMLLYHAQLSSILSKLPTDIQLDIAYAPAFTPTAVPLPLRNLAFERAAVLFNLAALYSQLATSEDRASTDGIKRATTNYQLAAGTLSYLLAAAMLNIPQGTENVPLDLTQPFVKSLEWLMLAQAQECSWQLAKLNQYKNGVIARLAAQAAAFYNLAYTTIRETDARIKQLFPADWLPHIEAKWYHFESVAQYRQSMDDIEARRYGHELARLKQAVQYAKMGFDIGKRGKTMQPVLQDAQSLLGTVQKSLTRAERDNDLIYHHDIPSISALPAIRPAPLVSSLIPPGLSNPASVLGDERPLFVDLLGWGAREAIKIYHDRKNTLVHEKVATMSQQLQDKVDHELRILNLPASLEALERPIGLPPSFLKKAEEVRSEGGPTRIEASIEDIQRLAHRDLEILDEAMDILDNEASEDEAARKQITLNRLPSYEANVKLVEKQKRYRSLLNQAAESDELVRQKWDEWEQNITELTWNEEDLESSVPSSTFASQSQLTPQGKQTLAHARSLRVLLESLDDLRKERDQIVKRAQRLAEADDIRSRIVLEASKYDKLENVQPLMFEEVLDEELAKYDKFILALKGFEERQNGILIDVKNQNDMFLQSRRDDPAIREREFALQSLDLSYFKYREIVRNLEEGFKFYNDLAGLLMNFREECKHWSHQRIQEIHTLNRAFRSLSISDGEKKDGDSSASSSKYQLPLAPSPTSPRHKAGIGKSSLGLPAITSNDWEEIPIPPGPKGKVK
ncbi:hypothetical protein AMATHDRAFT_138650 [Amanita thiersii Skay4041]|uniref:BRO1 domain-containing protein n=1 Tax=Amanita thiersii Skay4041 TaxID=703135 RepID=A0A2A9NQY9_9AGAR|nr:hypothetical protein AMATHDRAFT_138650 [Amanita thiersii Skay4041]